MNRKGYKGVVSCIGGFLLACETYEECKEELLYLINLVRKLGLRVSWKKVVSPTKHVTFLGVDIDTNDCVLFLVADKLNMLPDKLKAFKHRQRATKVLGLSGGQGGGGGVGVGVGELLSPAHLRQHQAFEAGKTRN